MSHHHITIEERACIALYLHMSKGITEIATLLGRSKSTISREIHRNKNCDNEYNACGANRKYHKRRRRCTRSVRLLTEKSLYTHICNGLEKYWSPEQICHTLPEGYDISVSTVYRAIKQKLFPKSGLQKLRRYGKQNRHTSKGICYDFSSVRTIAQRPKEVWSRQDIGHWELDTVVLRQECGCHLATMVERKSRFLIVKSISDKKAATMADTIIEAMKELPRELLKTLTVDRGLEFTDWMRVERELDVKVYFCDPYKPYQRGTNENTNGLIRQFYPRRTLLPAISEKGISCVQRLLNSRPRKCLDWHSPYQSFCCI